MPTTITKTIRASGGDYTTLSAWEAALPASLVANDECHVAECYNDWPSGLNDAVTISGPTTDATRFIKVTVAEGHGHGGLPDVGFYLINSVSSNTLNTVVDGLRVKRSGHCFLPGIADPTNVFQNCLAQTTSNAIGFAPTHGSNSVFPRLINCIAIGNGTGTGYYQANQSGRLRAAAYNCVAANYATGFVTSNSDIKNCVAFNCTTGFNGTARTTSASSDGTGNITGITSAAFVDATNNDFHLASGSALIGAGANLYSDFTTDIDGDTRPSSGAWDIGFDHYVAVGGGTTYYRLNTGGITLSGMSTKKTATSKKTGSITPSATISNKIVFTKLITGTLTVLGIIRKGIKKVTTGTTSISGIVRKKTTKRFEGSFSLSSILSRVTKRKFFSNITPFAFIHRSFSIKATLLGSTQPTGSVTNGGPVAMVPDTSTTSSMPFLRRFIGRR